MSDGASQRTRDSGYCSWSPYILDDVHQESRRSYDGAPHPSRSTTGCVVTSARPSMLRTQDYSADGQLWTKPRYDQSQSETSGAPPQVLPFRPPAIAQVQSPHPGVGHAPQSMHKQPSPRLYGEGPVDPAQNAHHPLHSPASSVSSKDFSPRRFSIDSHASQWNYGASVSRMCQNSEGNPFVQTYQTRQAILFSKREANETDKTLYATFKRKDKPRKFFVVGKVFLTWWAEPASDGADDARTAITGGAITVASFGQRVFSKIRRFIVVREGDLSCACLPILTYGGQGVSKRGTKKFEHAIIYTGKIEPLALPDERPARGEMGLLPSIRVDPDTPEQKLDPLSRVDFAKVYTIEHFAKVQSVGKINRQSMTTLVNQFQIVWSKNFESIGRQMVAAPTQPHQKTKESEFASHLERIAAYQALRASDWTKERACKVLFTDFELPVPTEILEGADFEDHDDQEREETHTSVATP